MDREKIHSMLFIFSSVLVVATLPFSIKLCSVAIIILTANWLIEGRMKAKWRLIKTNKLIWLFSGFFLLHVLGLLFTEDMDNGLFNLEKKLSLLIFPIVFGTSRPLSRKSILIIFNFFIMACLAAVLISFILVFTESKPPVPALLNFDYLNAEKFLKSSSGGTDTWNLISYAAFGAFLNLHPTYFSLYIGFALVLLLYNSGFTHYTVPRKALVILTIIIQVAALIFLSSRIVIAAFTVLCLVALGYFFFRKGKYFRGFCSCFAFLALLFSLVYINPVTRFRLIEEPLRTGLSFPETENGWNSWNLRLVEWQSSLNVIKNNWLTGVGTGDPQKHLDKEYAAVGLGFYDLGFNAHNQYLQTTLALGIAGLLVLLLSFIIPAVIAWQRSNKLYLVFILLFGICCLTESMLEVQKGVVFYGFFNSLLVFQLFQFNHSPHA